MADGPWLVVGLGNPGPRYEGTRHNAGALVLDRLVERAGDRFRGRRGTADVAETRLAGERVVLAKPRSYMNESGPPVQGLVAFTKVPLDRLVVVHDELDLPLGAVKLKSGGGDAGHNGLKSVRRSLGSGDYVRVRVGVGRPQGRQDPADYVLETFRRSEADDVELGLETAADAVETLLARGLEAAQNEVHRS